MIKNYHLNKLQTYSLDVFLYNLDHFLTVLLSIIVLVTFIDLCGLIFFLFGT